MAIFYCFKDRCLLLRHLCFQFCIAKFEKPQQNIPVAYLISLLFAYCIRTQVRHLSQCRWVEVSTEIL